MGSRLRPLQSELGYAAMPVALQQGVGFMWFQMFN